MSGNDNTGLVEEWIDQNPDAIAFSSHTMVGRIPNLADTQVVPAMMLRDPIARIRSAYRFERNQDAATWGAELAKTHDFEGYVRARLERKGDRQCRNFQTSRLATMAPGTGPELERAMTAAKQLHLTGMLGRSMHLGMRSKHLSAAWNLFIRSSKQVLRTKTYRRVIRRLTHRRLISC